MSSTTVIEIGPPRGYSAYEIAVQHGFEGTEAEWNAAVNAARLAAEQAAASAEEDAQQTALDRVATGEDRQVAEQSATAAVESKDHIDNLFAEFGITLDDALNS